MDKKKAANINESLVMIRKGWPPEKQIRSFLQEIPKIPETEQNVEPFLKYSVEDDFNNVDDDDNDDDYDDDDDDDDYYYFNRGFNCFLFMKLIYLYISLLYNPLHRCT